MEVPDLADGDFDHLTITGQLHVIEAAAQGEPVRLIGSSLGGYLAALYASIHAEAERLVLMAPAFNLAAGWRKRVGSEEMDRWKQLGRMPVQHYGDGLIHQLHYGFMEDAECYEAYPSFSQPAVIFHGRYDDVVPVEQSIDYARRHSNVELHVVDSGHELVDVLDPMWHRIAAFLA